MDVSKALAGTSGSSVVDDAIAHGRMTKARGGRIKYYDKKNNISVITEGDGRVVTVRYGS